MSTVNSVDQAIVLTMPVLVKALPMAEGGGPRKFSVGVSAEVVDGEGDIITQKALLDSAQSFIAKGGVIDRDHLSEIGARYGIRDPESYIIGRATEVIDLGKSNGCKETGIVGYLFENPKADEVWESLSKGEVWKSSIYGFPKPDGLIDCRFQKSSEFPDATRWVVKGIDWVSLALTKTPVNNGISHTAHIIKSQINTTQVITAKAWAHGLRQIDSYNALMKAPPDYPIDQSYPSFIHMPRNRLELLGHHTHHIQKSCPCAGPDSVFGNSVAGFRDHFITCCGADYDTADIFANSLMHLLKRR